MIGDRTDETRNGNGLVRWRLTPVDSSCTVTVTGSQNKDGYLALMLGPQDWRYAIDLDPNQARQLARALLQLADVAEGRVRGQ